MTNIVPLWLGPLAQRMLTERPEPVRGWGKPTTYGGGRTASGEIDVGLGELFGVRSSDLGFNSGGWES
jgi:hypothetical protein